MQLEHLIAAAMMASLTVYALTAGADFGGGVWDLLARGERAEAQRELIARAIAPIWEANHVWMILVVVLLFVDFPRAFAAICVRLHIPLALMLVGIVLRGAAFAFRSQQQPDRSRRRWSRTFAVASGLTPLFLGLTLGAVASGRVASTVPTSFYQGYLEPWLSPFAVCVGLLTVSLFALLAATYLAYESEQPALAGDFRRRALVCLVATLLCATAVLLVAPRSAPELTDAALRSSWTWPLAFSGAACAVGLAWALWTRRLGVARLLAAALTGVLLWGWGLTQFPYILPPELTFRSSAAPQPVLRLTLLLLIAATALIVPSLIYLYVVFKRRRTQPRPRV